MDHRGRFAHARGLLEEQKFDEAAEAVADLWRDLGDPASGFAPVRSAFMAGLLTQVAGAGPRPWRIVAGLRDAVAPAHGPAPENHAAVRDWCTLNISLGQTDRTLSWLDRVESDPAAVASLRPLASFLPLILRRAGRWPDVARWFPDPRGAIRAAYGAAAAWLKRLDATPERPMTRALLAFPRDRAALVYAALLAAGRENEAEAAAEVAHSLDAESRQLRLKLISTAVEEAGQARPRHLEWLDASGDRGEWAMELREKVVAGLAEGKGPTGVA